MGLKGTASRISRMCSSDLVFQVSSPIYNINYQRHPYGMEQTNKNLQKRNIAEASIGIIRNMPEINPSDQIEDDGQMKNLLLT